MKIDADLTRNVRELTHVEVPMPDGTFEIHTPRDSAGIPVAAKCWVGNSGDVATHAVVAAKLDDKLSWFIVQLRDEQTLEQTENVRV